MSVPFGNVWSPEESSLPLRLENVNPADNFRRPAQIRYFGQVFRPQKCQFRGQILGDRKRSHTSVALADVRDFCPVNTDHIFLEYALLNFLDFTSGKRVVCVLDLA